VRRWKEKVKREGDSVPNMFLVQLSDTAGELPLVNGMNLLEKDDRGQL